MLTQHLKHLRIFPLLLIMAMGSLAYSQPNTVRFRHISVEDGLSSSQVTSIVQDKKGFMWFGTWKGLNRYDGYEFKVFRHYPKDSLSLSDGGIFAMLSGRDGVVWVGTSTGLDKFDGATETFVHYVFENKDTSIRLQNNNVFALCEDRAGNIWSGCRYGLHCLNPVSGTIKSFANIPGNPLSLSHNFVTSICQSKDGAIWAGTLNGLNRIDPATGTCRRFLANPNDPRSPTNISNNRIYKIVEREAGVLQIVTSAGIDIYDTRSSSPVFRHEPSESFPTLVDSRDGSLWFVTKSGLRHQFRNDTTQFEEFRHSSSNPDGLCSNNINKLCQDREGNIWIGTDNGLSLLTPDAFQFRHFKNDPDDRNSLSHNVVLSVIEGRDGAVWLGTMGGGLNRLDPKTGNVHRYPFDEMDSPRSTNGGNVFRVVEDYTGVIWVGMMNLGLDRLDRKSGIFSHKKWGDIRDMVSFFYEDKGRVLWIGHQGGVSRFDRPSGNFEFSHYAPEAKGKGGLGVVTGILEDHTGAWWVSSNGYYLNRFDPKTMQYKRYLPDPKNPGSIRSDNIQAIYEDRKGQLWVAALNGLDLFDRKTETFTHFGLEDGLPDLVIGHLLEDGAGRLWMATGKGITWYNDETKTFHNYDKTDGLSSNESWDFIKSPSTGAFLLATADGLTIFHPDSLRQNQVAPPVVFTKLTRYDNSKNLEIEEKGILEKTEIALSHSDDILTFEFAALSFRKTSKNQYAYQLEGFNDQWIPLGTKREITFTNLAPGTYTLRVKGSNGDGIWNEEGASLNITITPPWWKRWWAYLIYTALIVSGLYGFYRFQLDRTLEHAENTRLKELDTFKTRLYTNITHEFRTPLTVISGMADQILEQPTEWLEAGSRLIKRNSDQLLRLVNQLLELSKLESGHMPLHLVRADVVAFLKYVVESFHSLAESKNIQLEMHGEMPELVMDFDDEKLGQIASNLLSNAIKFTPPGGSVKLEIGELAGEQIPQFLISVSDTGIGIAPEKLPFIFDRFYQVDDGESAHAIGTGIGLTLTRELVKLLGGDISVQSKLAKGTVFEVKLPLSSAGAIDGQSLSNRQFRAHEPEAAIFQKEPTSTISSDAPLAKNTEQPILLLIEDNPDVVRYLVAILEKDYQLDIARNGREGVEKAFETVPDIIISDVMMPEMNGIEVCQVLKNDVRSSHIPIVLLTAKADTASKIEGLEHGADAYLAKPFEKEELLVWVKKLLEIRLKLQQHYLSLATVAIADLPLQRASESENAFLQKAKTTVETHLNDTQFDLAHFSRALAMSQSQLHRKLVALTGLSPNRFMRHIRLKKGQTMLLESDKSVSSIAYDTGFSDPAYFIRAFRKEFGETPLGYKKKNLQ